METRNQYDSIWGPSMLHVLLVEPFWAWRLHSRASWLCFGRLQKPLQAFSRTLAGSQHRHSQGGLFRTSVILFRSIPWEEKTEASLFSFKVCKELRVASLKSTRLPCGHSDSELGSSESDEPVDSDPSVLGFWTVTLCGKTDCWFRNPVRYTQLSFSGSSEVSSYRHMPFEGCNNWSASSSYRWRTGMCPQRTGEESGLELNKCQMNGFKIRMDSPSKLFWNSFFVKLNGTGLIMTVKNWNNTHIHRDWPSSGADTWKTQAKKTHAFSSFPLFPVWSFELYTYWRM